MKGSAQVGARRRLTIAALAAVLTVSVISVVAASARPVARHVPSAKRVSSELFDSRATGASVSPSRAVVRARAALAQRLGSQGVVIADRQTGTLRMVGRLDGFLTGASVRPAAQVGMHYVRSHLLAFGLNRADLRTFHLRQDYVDIAGTHHVSWIQRAGGVTAFRSGLKANVTADGRLINVTGPPVHGLQRAVGAPARDRDRRARRRPPLRRCAETRSAARRHGEAGAVRHAARRADGVADPDLGEPGLPRAVGRRRADR